MGKTVFRGGRNVPPISLSDMVSGFHGAVVELEDTRVRRSILKGEVGEMPLELQVLAKGQ